MRSRYISTILPSTLSTVLRSATASTLLDMHPCFNCSSVKSNLKSPIEVSYFGTELERFLQSLGSNKMHRQLSAILHGTKETGAIDISNAGISDNK